MTAETEIYSTPSLPDKAPGIHDALGSSALLLRVIQRACKASGDASAVADQFARLQADQGEPFVHCIGLGRLVDWANDMAADVGRLLACVDVTLAAADYGTPGADCTERMRMGYYLEYQDLLRLAQEKGLSPDYTSAPMREARRRDCGLQRPDIAKGGNKNT